MGLRRSELFALTWRDVDVKQGVMRIVHSKNGKRREIPMTNTLRATCSTSRGASPQTMYSPARRDKASSMSASASIGRYGRPA
jgi:integrase